MQTSRALRWLCKVVVYSHELPIPTDYLSRSKLHSDFAEYMSLESEQRLLSGRPDFLHAEFELKRLERLKRCGTEFDLRQVT